jgi:uncharacterized protein YecT (DUF1311 family)
VLVKTQLRHALLAGAMITVLAACGSSASSAAGGAAAATSAAASAAPSGSAPATSPPPASSPSASSPAAFAGIVEPFDPGHAARTAPDPGNCGNQQTTLGMEQCYETKTENADAKIDAAQLASYQSASPAQQAAIQAQDRAWLAARGPVCSAAFKTGGSIDVVNIASCLVDESTARLDALTGVTPAEDVLQTTDSLDLSQLYWYTTPGGSRIATIDTQGDQTGGVIIAWVIIGGAQGFVVNPGQFSYRDGSFADAGIVEPPSPLYHRVATGAVYQFSIDYSKLPADPNETKGTGGYVYAPGGTALAIWK